jgi:hypothetical protein
MIQMNSGISAYTDKHFTSGHARPNRQDLLSDFGQVMEKKRQEIDVRKTGDYKPKIQTGANSYSEDGWNRMMENFDAVQNGIRSELDQELEDFKIDEKSA